MKALYRVFIYGIEVDQVWAQNRNEATRAIWATIPESVKLSIGAIRAEIAEGK